MMTSLTMSRLDKLPELVKILIKKTIDINATSKYGETPLHNICGRFRKYSGSINAPEHARRLKIVQLLIDAGIDINLKNIHGHIALQYIFDYYESFKLPIAQLLIKSGSDLDLHIIVKLNQPDIYQAIIKYHKHNHGKIQPFIKYFDKEQVKLLKCFSQLWQM